MTTLSTLLSYTPFDVPDSTNKDILIRFDKCGYRGPVLVPTKIIPTQSSVISESNVLMEGGEIVSNATACLIIRGPSINKPKKTFPLTTYFPSGGMQYEVKSHDFKEGDDIVINWTGSKQWITKLNMTKYWKSSFTLTWYTKVKEVNGSLVSFTTPITYGLDPSLGSGTIGKYVNNRIKNIIVRNLTIRTSNKAPKTQAILIENAENVIIENVKVYGYDRAVKLSDGSNHCTVKGCISYEPNAVSEGGNRYAFEIDAGNNHLVRDCEAYKSRHPYAGGGRCSGPHVFFRSKALQNEGTATSQPHRLWGNGFLYDNIEESNGIDFENREDSGSGHGWAAANCMAYNCKAKMVSENPPTARNWAIGCVGGRNTFYKGDPKRPMNTMISEGASVEPKSIYEWQLGGVPTDPVDPDPVKKKIQSIEMRFTDNSNKTITTNFIEEIQQFL